MPAQSAVLDRTATTLALDRRRHRTSSGDVACNVPSLSSLSVRAAGHGRLQSSIEDSEELRPPSVRSSSPMLMLQDRESGIDLARLAEVRGMRC